MSTQGRPGPIVPFKAAAALAVNRFVALADAGAGYSATERTIGVTDRPAKAGDNVDVRVYGVAAVEAAGAFATGARIVSDADGKAVAFTRGAIHHAVVDGAAANTDIAVAGIVKGDWLDAIVAVDGTEVTGPTIHSDGNVRVTSNAAGKKLLVVWRGALQTPAAIALPPAAAAGDIVRVLLTS